MSTAIVRREGADSRQSVGPRARTGTPRLTDAQIDAALEVIHDGGSVGAAADRIGVRDRTLYRLFGPSGRLRDRYLEAIDSKIERLEDAARSRALDPNDPESGRLLMFLLKGYRRDVFGDRMDVRSTNVNISAGELKAVREAAAAHPEAFEAIARALAAGGDDAGRE